MPNVQLSERIDNLQQNLRRRLRAGSGQTPQRSVQIDYRDRISVVTWVLVFGLGTSILLELPTAVFTFRALGSPISIPFSERIIAAAFLAVLAAVGTESVVSVHPYFSANRQGRTQTWAFWALPSAITIISVLLLPLLSGRQVTVLALLISGALLALSFFGLYATVEPGQPGFRRSRFMLDALAYGSALLLFLLVYQTRTRSLLSGTLIAATAMLLAVELLRSTTTDVKLVLSYGAIVGIILGEVTWALNYWLLPESYRRSPAPADLLSADRYGTAGDSGSIEPARTHRIWGFHRGGRGADRSRGPTL